MMTPVLRPLSVKLWSQASTIARDQLPGATPEERRPLSLKVEFMTAAAPPPAAVLEALEKENFRVTHVYGLTEVYGPATICSWHEAWDALPSHERARLKARQGVRYTAEDGVTVALDTALDDVLRREGRAYDLIHQDNSLRKESENATLDWGPIWANNDSENGKNASLTKQKAKMHR